jgi:hypothetical protein
MEMHQVRYFLALSATLNFTRAAETCNMLEGFEQFMLSGNVLDLAVAVVTARQFGTVVTAPVRDLGSRAPRAVPTRRSGG